MCSTYDIFLIFVKCACGTIYNLLIVKYTSAYYYICIGFICKFTNADINVELCDVGDS